MDRIEIDEHATTSMPTTAEIVQKAAALLQPILPPEFFGRVSLFFEHGKPSRMVKEESFRL